ncbi:transcriptional regulator [Pararhizobium sp. YC-54]|uniref:transcriptional regulator n=1 Tax=Pararhizobium sp. YC-54 TaxID=2986920 RepID=UPI0021F75066|nr:transcriptional regulator [Pararhizobium sp. YC-54]MCV9999398.1 transcriptional regulator [Pararhizobium sp. YC-54]
MKKVQRSFAVEYKFGRRKPVQKSNSIWGDMDLKSVARDVQEVTPFRPAEQFDNKSADELFVLKAEPETSLLTPPIRQHTTAAMTQEAMMADEFDTITTTDALAVVETPVAPQKQRKPRVKRAASDAASIGTGAEPAVTPNVIAEKQKRGRKAKSIENVATAKRAPVRRAPRGVETAPAVPTAPSDELADLLQLEEENQRLRRLLAEKLRAENADLRKRLKLD